MSDASVTGTPAPVAGGGALTQRAVRRAPRWLGYALAAGGVAVLALFAATTNFHEVMRVLRGVRPAAFGFIVAAVLLQIALRAVRWRYMIARVAGVTVSGRFAAVSVVCGVAAGSMAPGRSFELAKAVMLRDGYGVGFGVAISAMLIERLLDIVTLICGLLAAAVLLPSQTVLHSAVLLALIAAILAAAVILAAAPYRLRAVCSLVLRAGPQAIRDRALGFVELLCGSVMIWRRRQTLGSLAALSVAIIAADLSRVITVFWALHSGLSAAIVVFTYVGAAILGIALLVPGGVGVTEVSQAGLIAVFAPASVSAAVARSGVLLDRILSYYAVLVVGGLLLMAYQRYHRLIR